jgi:hypothetical protein
MVEFFLSLILALGGNVPHTNHDGTIHVPNVTPGGGCIDGAPC